MKKSYSNTGSYPDYLGYLSEKAISEELFRSMYFRTGRLFWMTTRRFMTGACFSDYPADFRPLTILDLIQMNENYRQSLN